MRGSRRRNQPDVELTPLIDVLFILIIFFVLTTSFIKSQVEIELPGGKGNPMEGTPAIITVTRSGLFVIDGSPARENRVLSYAREAVAADRDIVIMGDREADYGTVASLLDLLRSEGIESVGLALGDGSSP